MGEIVGLLVGRLVVVPSNPLTTDAHGNVTHVLPDGSPHVEAGTSPC